MKHSEFLAEVSRIETELGALIERAHLVTPPTVEWCAMLAWAACARGALMGLAELGIPDSETPLEPSSPPSPNVQCLFCKSPREPQSKYCERHRGGVLHDDDFKGPPR